MLKLLFVGIGGALGAVLRYELDNLIMGGDHHTFPWGTLAVNLVGCFIIGISYKVFYYELLHAHLKNLIITGFLGALTTFSSYSYATLMLFEQGRMNLGLANLLFNNVFGIFFAFLGSRLTGDIINKYFKKVSKGG